MLRPGNVSLLFCGTGALPLRFFCPGVVDSHTPEVQQRPQSEQPDNEQRGGPQAEFQIEHPNRLARQGLPCQQPEHDIGCYRQRELSIDAQLPSPPQHSPGAQELLVHREGFEPSYLARRSRFTVCRL
jgi:hypothetical protein